MVRSRSRTRRGRSRTGYRATANLIHAAVGSGLGIGAEALRRGIRASSVPRRGGPIRASHSIPPPRYSSRSTSRNSMSSASMRSLSSGPARYSRRYKTFTQGLGVKKAYKGTLAKTSTAQKLGCVRRVESGGIVQDADCVYVGHHDMPGQEMFDMFCRSVIRTLVRRAGMDVSSWESGLPWVSTTDNFALRILTVYQPFGGSTNLIPTSPFDIGGGLTLNSLTTGLVGQLRGIQTANPEARLVRIDLQTLDPNRTISSIECGSSHVSVKVVSKLMIQNRTKSSNQPAAGELINDVTNNPLVGYLYHTKGSGFRPRLIFNNLETDATVGQGFLANNATGLITAVADTTNPSQSKKPLFGSHFQGKVHVNKVQVLPGGIRKNTLIHLKKYRLNDFWRKINDDIVPSGDNNRNYRFVGESGMFGLEKALNARDDEPDVVVGWELNQVYSMFVTGSLNKYIMPLVSIKTSAQVEQQPQV
jgi:hypothetical protein